MVVIVFFSLQLFRTLPVGETLGCLPVCVLFPFSSFFSIRQRAYPPVVRQLPEVMDVLATGCMYIGGRDSGMRPMIVLHIEKLPTNLPIESVVRAFIFIQEYASLFI